MKRKLLALLLSSVMASALLAGCGKTPESDSASAQTEEGKAATGETQTQAAGNEGSSGDNTESAASPAQQAIADRKAEAEKTGEYEQVVFAFYTWTGRPAGTDRVQEAMNEYTREKLGLEVELLPMDSASYAQDIRLMLSSGEKVDLFDVDAIGYSAAVNDGYCMDLEENGLFQDYGQGIAQVLAPEYVNALRVDGILYGLTPIRDLAIASGTFCIGQEYLDGIGYDYNSNKEKDGVIHTDFAEIDEIFAQLHEKYPDKYVFTGGDNVFLQGSIVDNVGGDWFGVLIDPVNSLKVENLFTSDIFKERCQIMYDWNKKGYISKDSLTDDTAISAKVKAGNYMAMMSQGKPGYQTQISAECGRTMELFQVDENIMKSSTVTGVVTSINQNCENPVAAMQLWDALYTDPYLSNLLMWGEEDVDYKVTEDGHIIFADGVNADNAEFYHTMNWELPNQYIAHVWEGDPLDLGAQMTAFNDGAVKSKALGFAFDNSEMASEYTALKNIYDEYAKQLMMGFLDPEVGIPEMESKMESAGLMDYIAAKQAALDAWAEENGVQ